MRILVVTYFHSPDIRPGAFRSEGLVRALRELGGGRLEIDVVTTVPQRGGVDQPALREESADGLSIHRVALPQREGGMLAQAMAFTTFFLGATRFARGRRYDLVFATSGRLMTGVLGAWIARRQRAVLYLDLRDIFVENIGEMLPRGMGTALGWIFDRLERWMMARASKVNLVSAGFAPYFTARYPGRRFSYLTNGIDDEFSAWLPPGQAGAPAKPAGPLTVLYAGNLGDGQGLHRIVPELARRMGTSVRFRIIGDGNSREPLVAALAARGVATVEILPPVSRARLLGEYRSADVLFLHLNDYVAFLKVLPSKIFEYGAIGKPIWAGVAGYPAEFIRSELTNAVVFPPCDPDAAMAAFQNLELADRARPAFVEKFSRRAISLELARDIIGWLPLTAASRGSGLPDLP